jgi:hypothetical protein
MKSKWNLLLASIATALLLSACGTDAANEKPGEDTNSSSGVVEEVENDTTDENETEDPATDVDESANNEEDVLKDAVQTKSDAQDYSIAVLPNYTLTSEEPGRDSLLVDDNDAVFMRIETVKKEEGTYAYLEENMAAVLEASSGGVEPTEVTETASMPSGEGIENVKVLSVQAESGPVTGVIFERGEMVVRLTIFDSPKEEYFENFLRMGETIVQQ